MDDALWGDLQDDCSTLVTEIDGVTVQLWKVGESVAHPAREIVGNVPFVLAAAPEMDDVITEQPRTLVLGTNTSAAAHRLAGAVDTVPPEFTHTANMAATEPLDMPSARAVLSAYLQSSATSSEASTMVMVYCSADTAFVTPDTPQLVYIGAKRQPPQSEGSGSSGYESFSICVQELSGGDLESVKPVEFVSGAGDPIDVSVKTAYVVGGPESTTTVEVTADGRKCLMGPLVPPPPPAFTGALLRMRFGFSDTVSPADAATDTLNRLISLTSEAWGESAAVAADSEGVLNTFLSAEEEIASQGGVGDPTDGEWAEQTAAALGVSSLPPRHDLDFTERLWLFVKNAHSTAELREWLAKVFEWLAAPENSPIIHKTNSTSLGLLLREKVKATAALEGREQKVREADEKLTQLIGHWLEFPVKGAVELGVYHAVRNYTFWLGYKNLAARSALSWFLDPTLDTDELLFRLARLHAVVAAVYAANALGTPFEGLRMLCKMCLDHYASLPIPEDTDVSELLVGGVSSVAPPLSAAVSLPLFSKETSAVVESACVCPPLSATYAILMREIDENETMNAVLRTATRRETDSLVIVHATKSNNLSPHAVGPVGAGEGVNVYTAARWLRELPAAKPDVILSASV